MNYPGGKNRSGVYQQIINLMPPHQVYIEAFLGSGAIMRQKRPAAKSIGVEIDGETLKFWKGDEIPNLKIFSGDAVSFLEALGRTQFESIERRRELEQTLIYCDPPYLQSVRQSKSKIYRCEMMQEDEHARLLQALLDLPCMILLSGYDSELYNGALTTWRKHQFQTTNRAGKPALETVWMNFPEPAELHDYNFLGADFRERERIKRKRQRWKNRLLKMDSQEKFALLATLAELQANPVPPRHF